MNSDGQTFQASLPPDAPELIAHMLGDLYLGLDTTIVASAAEGYALLDEAAAQLARGRTRVLRVPAPSPGSLTLAGLLTRLGPVTEGGKQAPEQGIEALTQLDPSCDRIALLVSSAEGLDYSALRAIQIAAEAQPKLRLVLAGTPALLEILEHPELNLLHSRLNRALGSQDDYEERDDDEDGDGTETPDASPVLAAPLEPAPANKAHRPIRLAAAAMVVFATVGLGIFVSHTAANTAALTHPPAAQLTRADTPPARPQAQSQAQTVPQDQPQTSAASNDAPTPPPAMSGAPPQTITAAPVASAPTAPAPISSASASPALAGSAQTRPESQVASSVPPILMQPVAPAAPMQPPAAAHQASLPLLLKHREPTLRHLAAPAPQYTSRSLGGIDQPGADQAFADARLLQLKHDLSDRPPDPSPPVSYEPRQQQDNNAWPLPADQPHGTIGTYSGGPGGIRAFHYGS